MICQFHRKMFSFVRTENGLKAETGLTIKMFNHLLYIVMNFHHIDENKIISNYFHIGNSFVQSFWRLAV